MKALCRQYAFIFFAIISTAHAQTVLKTQDLQLAKYLSLEGKALSAGDKTDAYGNVRQFKMPLLRLFRTRRLHPHTIIVDIGTNNTSQTEDYVRKCLTPKSLLWLSSQEKDPQHPRRLLINEINRNLAVFAKENHLTLLDIGPKMLNSDGTFLPGIMSDYTHPADKGYQIWADAIRPYIEEP